MTEPQVHFEQRGPVAVLTLDAPPANCYSVELMKSLDAAILQARFTDSVQAIVITGQGHKFFCAGADIAMLQRVTPEFKYQFCLHANETLLRLEHTAKPVVAAVNGHCVGGGLEVAMAADLRIARAGAGVYGLPEAKLGVLPGTGGTQRLARLVGKQKAMRWMLEARTAPLADGADHDVFDHVYDCAPEEFLDRVVAYAEGLCAPTSAPLAMGHIKRAVQSGIDLPLESGLALERELQQRLFTSDDAREGLDAYVGKRAAEFTGR